MLILKISADLVAFHRTGLKPARSSAVSWTPVIEKAFTSAKKTLATASLLVHPQKDAVTSITVDASDIAMGGVLEQRIDGQWKPLAFFSKKLQPVQAKYSAFDRELLAAHLAIRHFRHFLEGRQLTLYTDHNPLTAALSKVSDAWSARQQRQLSAISEFTTDLCHFSGKDNVVADTLSRAPGPPVANTWRCGKCGHRDESFLSPPCMEIWSVSLSQSAVAALSAGVDFAALAGAQAENPEEMAACRTAITGLRLADIPFGQNKVTLLCDVSGLRPQPLVPIPFRRQIFDALHNLSHPAIRATKKIACVRQV
jgi:hypothetical protein